MSKEKDILRKLREVDNAEYVKVNVSIAEDEEGNKKAIAFNVVRLPVDMADAFIEELPNIIDTNMEEHNIENAFFFTAPILVLDKCLDKLRENGWASKDYDVDAEDRMVIIYFEKDNGEKE